MKYVIFANAYDINEIIKDKNHIDDILDFDLLKITCEEDYIKAFSLIEMRGSYAFLSENDYCEIEKIIIK